MSVLARMQTIGSADLPVGLSPSGTAPTGVSLDVQLHAGNDDHVLDRQIPPDHGHEEDRKIDREADIPEDRAERRPVAKIGQDISQPNDQE